MELFAYHNSHKLYFRAPFGAVTCEQTILLRLEICSVLPVEDCFLRVWEKEQERLIPMAAQKPAVLPDRGGERLASAVCTLKGSEQRVVFEAEYVVPGEPGLVWYYFKFSVGGQNYFYGNSRRLGGEGLLEDHQPPSYQVTVYYPMKIPDWYQKGIMYQIYVDRFYQTHEEGFHPYPRRNALIHANWDEPPIYVKDEEGRVTYWDFFGGSLLGVIKKLPYLQELGISVIYFNPLFDAPSNHKYDTADYLRIDPMYGDEEIFERLVLEMRNHGISIILDGVFSHTGSDSIYFNRYGNYPSLGAYQSKNSPYYQWYRFKENNEDYQSWWNVDALPEVNELEPSYQDFIFDSESGVLQKWMKKGIAGWRLDVADELPDKFIRKFRELMKSLNHEAVLIGEVWEDVSNKQSYGQWREYFWGYELDAAMNYPFRDIVLSYILGKLSSGMVHLRVMSLFENYPWENFRGAMNLLGSHDRERILTLLGEAPPEKTLTETQKRTFKLTAEARRLAVQRLKLLTLIQMTFPGVPCIYYGDEAGMEGYSDPYNRGTFPWGQEDKEILTWYKRVVSLRREYEAFQAGDFHSFFLEPDIYGFRRFWRDEEISVMVNRSLIQSREIALDFDSSADYKLNPFCINLLSGETLDREAAQNPQTLKLDPLSTLVLLKKQSRLSFPQQDFCRACGILMPISSLPSDFGSGSGDFGAEAYGFIDFLVDTGQSLWQVLPLNPVGLGDSPYQSDSAFAGNYRLISLELLIREGLLQESALKTFSQSLQSPGRFKESCLREAFKVFRVQIQKAGPEYYGVDSKYLSRQNYVRFLSNNREWLDDYALYRALKAYFPSTAWYEWEPEIACRNPVKLAEYSQLLEEDMEFQRFVQYTFYFQWRSLKEYAAAKHIKMIGDIPLFVAGDSCDVWANRKFFKLDERGFPLKVAGVPPDYFSETGQLWGNPVYDWDALAAQDYVWWKKRIELALRLFDYVRLDHFRGFESYWEIDVKEETAIHGHWMKGPGKRFFESLAERFGELPFIAEDLGIITTEVTILKRIFGFPGMKVLQFTSLEDVDSEGDMNIVYYSGTHDNDTLLGWYKSTMISSGEESHCNQESENEKFQEEGLKRACRKLIEELYLSQAAWVITPMQDVLGLDSKARMNVPGTVKGNWGWTLNKNLLTTEVKTWLRYLARNAQR
ncbi:4-alpha-glucanotransferase [Desulfosporosinus acididurans]|uniref:4-alpha-glucanotransferase n=1 Tax=Desulfosporosinus acididurans TaxID=476652 RepID=A0A0J1FQ88_9FIRM|nr:bifunctional glycogen debranching protein GlgX/4-alpha-glucanotransferase [Desulfosporosinus acididurans]KLU65477.1 4-alpha-glucanotransferase [Desulfosporosinus acididurans]